MLIIYSFWLYVLPRFADITTDLFLEHFLVELGSLRSLRSLRSSCVACIACVARPPNDGGTGQNLCPAQGLRLGARFEL